MTAPVNGQVDKVIRIVGTSPTSWEDAARSAVSEAGSTVRDVQSARVSDADITVRGDTRLYRVSIELGFRLDRNRIDAAGNVVSVKRFLIIANQTLVSAGLEQHARSRVAQGPAEFHVLVPQAPAASAGIGMSGVIDPRVHSTIASDYGVVRADAEGRLESFRAALAGLGAEVTGEISIGDPVLATRRVMERSSFDEIIVSTLPSGLSRWLKMDLPARIERSFDLPVTTLVQQEAPA